MVFRKVLPTDFDCETAAGMEMAQSIINVLNGNAETITRALNDERIPKNLPMLMLSPLNDKEVTESAGRMDVHNIVDGLVSLNDKAEDSEHSEGLQKILEKIKQIIKPPQKEGAKAEEEKEKKETLGDRIKQNFENRYHEKKSSGDKSPRR